MQDRKLRWIRALRFSVLLLLLLMLSVVSGFAAGSGDQAETAAAPREIVNPSFETGDLTGWTIVSGTAFSNTHISNASDWGWGCCFNPDGTYFYWGAQNTGDAPTGEMHSSVFTLEGSGRITFLIGGGNDINNLYVALMRASDDKELMRATNVNFADSEAFNLVEWNASAYLGEELYFKVVDNASGGWGHINVDGFRTYIPNDIENPSFETGDLTGWTVITGTAFSDARVTNATDWGWGCCFNPDGTYHFWGAKDGGDAPTGEMRSSTFRLDGTGAISFLIGGGNDINNLYVALVRASDGTELMKATNTAFADSEAYSKVTWDASAHLGEEVYIKVVDNATGGWGHINVDGFDVYEPVVSNEIENPSFETGDLTGWTVITGTAFSDARVTNATDWGWGCCFNPDGTYHFWGAKDGGDAPTGEMRSSTFTLAGTGEVSFLIGGGNDIDNLYVALVRESDGAELMKATNTAFADSEAYTRVTWDASAYLGKNLYFKVVDKATGGWGHINVDGFRTVSVLDIPMTPMYWPFDEGAGSRTTEVISNVTDTIHYVFNDAKFKPDSDPLWKDGIKGKALLFDGYSTWIERPASAIFTPSSKLMIQAWVAPRSYEWGDLSQPSAIVSQYNKKANEGYVLGMYRHGTLGFDVGVGGNWYSVRAEGKDALPLDQWSFVVGVFDGAAGKLQLYRNGELVAETNTPKGLPITPHDGTFAIGRATYPAIINGVFTANMFNGLIDELRITKEISDTAGVRQIYSDTLAALGGSLPLPDTAAQRSRFDGDRYRPQYHFMPPEHWMNEPHAPIFWNGMYHIFYQKNPQGPYWHQIHWGHAISTDMVHWTELPPALRPTAGSVAPDGVWSGSATTDANGNPVLFFTAGDDSKSPNQSTGLATPLAATNPLTSWVMYDQPVTVQTPGLPTPTGEVWFGQFRDPFVWKEVGQDGKPIWYQLVGSGIREQGGGAPIGGTALLYTSTDLYNWTYRGPLFIGDVKSYPATGHVWELPVLLPLGKDSQGIEKHIFLINPWFDGYSPYNVKYVWYWVGRWDATAYKFIPDSPEPKLLDYGEHFTGPSGHVDGQGRTILWTIAQDRRTEQDHYAAGWAHNAGLPVVLSLLPDDTVGIRPIDELHSLRQSQVVSLTNTSLADTNAALLAAHGQLTDTQEILLTLQPGNATRFGVDVRRSQDGREFTRFGFEASSTDRTVTGTFSVDRTWSSLDPDPRKGIHSGPLTLNDDGSFTLHVYVDRSMVEAYANGRKSITTRIYPTLADAVGVHIWANGTVTVTNLSVWNLGSAYGSLIPSVYPPAKKAQVVGEFPNGDFQTCDLTGWTIVSGNPYTNTNVTTRNDWGWGGDFRQAHAWGSQDRCHLWGFNDQNGGDGATGVMRSQTFTLAGDGQIDFLIAGGYDPDNLYVALVRASDQKILFKETGKFYDSYFRAQYERRHWDASAYVGQELYLEVVDNATDGWGHISLDDINIPLPPHQSWLPLVGR
ncbi:MAG: hypothetical protein KatS3mg050_4549 [Litorilinea sp.]|nr:MAG: hypothetical protein KatS3mg050_4549 [Litorilinea sp.]